MPAPHRSVLLGLLLAACSYVNPDYGGDATDATTGAASIGSSASTSSGASTSGAASAPDTDESQGSSGTSSTTTSATTTGAATTEDTSGTTTAAAPACGDGTRDPGELCDDGDDDDANGCTRDCLPTPTVLLVGPPEMQPIQGSDEGFTKYTDVCPNGLVRGLRVTPDNNDQQNWVAGLQVYCGAPALAGLSITITDAPPLPNRKGDYAQESKAKDLVCPANEVAVITFGSAGTVVDNIGLRCAALTLEPTPEGYVVAPGPVTTVGPHGNQNGTTFEDVCVGGAVSGAYIHLGSWVNGYATQCAEVTVD